MSTPPAQLIERLLQQKVTVTLKDGRTLSGKLAAVDDHLNVVLDETEETAATVVRHLGRVVLRGSSVVSLNAASGSLAKRP